MVSLGADSSFRDNILARSSDSGQQSRIVHSDTSHLMQENDDLTFWDMSAGGNFSSTVAITAGEDEDIRKFRRIGSIPVIVVLIIFLLLNALIVFILPTICPEKCNGVTLLSVIVYLQIGLFFLVFAADFILRRMHFKSRSWGYLEFYRKTRIYRKFPLSAMSVCVTAFLFLVTLTEEVCLDQQSCGSHFSRANVLQVVTGLEILVIVPALVKYLYICYKFNAARSTPDVLQEDLSTERIMQISINHGNQAGFREGNFKEDLLEKQADEILFLKRRNSYLTSRILHLTTQIHASSELPNL